MFKQELPEDLVLPDYEESILNLSCSILKHYGIEPSHPTLPAADDILSRKFKHVVVILLDGLGTSILEKNLYYNDFLRRNLLCEYSSVFPPTTTASTTSFLSGKSPIEHGWLGWDLYFKQEDKTVTCFTNNLQSTDIPAADYKLAEKYLPYENIIDQINKTGNAKAYGIFPFGPDAKPELNKWVDAIRKTCKGDKNTFTYAYWENPDYLLHRNGSKSNDVTKVIQELNEKMTFLCEDCPDTVFFITADHGHTDILSCYIEEDYPVLAKMLERRPSIEPRAISFFVKPECLEEFPKEFYKHFYNEYILFSRQEVLENELFGPGKPNENLTGIGDFIAVAFKNRTLFWNKKEPEFKSHHAGLSKEEMKIPLICYKNKPKHIGLYVFYAIFLLILVFIIMGII